MVFSPMKASCAMLSTLPLTAGVTLLIVLLMFGTAFAVGKGRHRYGIEAPAVSGHPAFERLYRVQMNTLELMVALLPSLFVAARFWPAPWVAGLGAVYLIGRFIYWRAYVGNPASRTLGFLLSMLPILTLMVLALAGAVLR